LGFRDLITFKGSCISNSGTVFSTACLVCVHVDTQYPLIPTRSQSQLTMAQLQAERQFHYRTVQIIKSTPLGIGSYGAVYMARCDELPCAAKIIHPTLFKDNDPGAQKIVDRFDQECEFLSSIRHPNICAVLGNEQGS